MPNVTIRLRVRLRQEKPRHHLMRLAPEPGDGTLSGLLAVRLAHDGAARKHHDCVGHEDPAAGADGRREDCGKLRAHDAIQVNFRRLADPHRLVGLRRTHDERHPGERQKLAPSRRSASKHDRGLDRDSHAPGLPQR